MALDCSTSRGPMTSHRWLRFPAWPERVLGLSETASWQAPRRRRQEGTSGGSGSKPFLTARPSAQVSAIPGANGMPRPRGLLQRQDTFCASVVNASVLSAPLAPLCVVTRERATRLRRSAEAVAAFQGGGPARDPKHRGEALFCSSLLFCAGWWTLPRPRGLSES